MVDYLVGNKDVLVCNKIYFILNGVLKWFIKWVNNGLLIWNGLYLLIEVFLLFWKLND